MGRTIKTPEERIEEILDAAIDVFIEKGFEKATINDIIEKKNISHGIIYHYFKSKEEILDILIESYIKTVISDIVMPTISDRSLNALEKLKFILEEEFVLNKDNRSYIYKFRSIKDRFIRQVYIVKIFDDYVPALLEIVNQGISEGYFKAEYPLESVKFAILGLIYFFDLRIIKSSDEEFKKIIEATPSIVENILQAEKGSFIFMKEFFYNIKGKLV